MINRNRKNIKSSLTNLGKGMKREGENLLRKISQL
jgi:hypothetical protein